MQYRLHRDKTHPCSSLIFSLSSWRYIEHHIRPSLAEKPKQTDKLRTFQHDSPCFLMAAKMSFNTPKQKALDLYQHIRQTSGSDLQAWKQTRLFGDKPKDQFIFKIKWSIPPQSTLWCSILTDKTDSTSWRERKKRKRRRRKKKILLRVPTHPPSLSFSFSLHLSTRPQVLYCISNRSFLTVINAHQIPPSRSEETQSALMPFTHS